MKYNILILTILVLFSGCNREYPRDLGPIVTLKKENKITYLVLPKYYRANPILELIDIENSSKLEPVITALDIANPDYYVYPGNIKISTDNKVLNTKMITEFKVLDLDNPIIKTKDGHLYKLNEIEIGTHILLGPSSFK
jgi:hypothetical protein